MREPQEEKPNLRAQQHLATVEKTLKQKSGWEIGGFQFLLIPTVEGEAAATPCRFLYDFSYWLVPAEWEKRFPQSSFGLASFPGPTLGLWDKPLGSSRDKPSEKGYFFG